MDDLSSEQLGELRTQLQVLVTELEADLTAAKTGSQPVDLDEPIGRLSRMDAMQQQQMTKAHRRRIELRLQQAQAALARMERDEYGECLACGEPISAKRLRAKPESPTCLACQSERERGSGA